MHLFTIVKQLESIDFEINTLRKISSCVTNVTSLKQLNVSKNRLTEIPNELENLDLSQNKLKNFPANMSQAKSLKQIDLSGNNIFRSRRCFLRFQILV